MKDRALNRLQEPSVAIRCYRAPDSLSEFLKALQLCKVAGVANPVPAVPHAPAIEKLFITEDCA